MNKRNKKRMKRFDYKKFPGIFNFISKFNLEFLI